MPEISVELNAVIAAIKACSAIRTELSNEATKMHQQCSRIGNEWKDEKSKEFEQIVFGCSNALKKPLSELQRCETFLKQLASALSEYESIHFSSIGAASSASSDSRQYSNTGRGRAISRRWFNRMSEAAARNIDYRHQRSIRSYCSDGYVDINELLRGTTTHEHTPEYTRIIHDDIDNLTEVLNNHQLSRNMTLYRGVTNPGFMLGRNWEDMSTEELNTANIGQVFHDDGFLSTSTHPDGAGEFAQCRTGATVIIQAPANANGMCVGSFNPRSNESEVLLQRGSDLRIDSISRNSYGNCIINATLIGRRIE